MEKNKKSKVRIILETVGLILAAAGLIANIDLLSYPLVPGNFEGFAKVIRILGGIIMEFAFTSALLYLLNDAKKSGAFFFKGFAALAFVTYLVCGLCEIKGGLLKPILFGVCFVLLAIISVAKDLGKPLSVTFGIVTVLINIAVLVLDLSHAVTGTVLLYPIVALLLALIVLVCVLLKYADKFARANETNS